MSGELTRIRSRVYLDRVNRMIDQLEEMISRGAELEAPARHAADHLHELRKRLEKKIRKDT